jgi:hypothetical protein
MMPSRYVKVFLKGQKNDFRDAEATTEAARTAARRPAPNHALCADADVGAA